MTDRELLELAAKASGLKIKGYVLGRNRLDWVELECITRWNPLHDDGDAMRLAVNLFIQVRPESIGRCNVQTLDGFMRTESGYEDTGEATRRAIVRAAAEIGKAMP